MKPYACSICGYDAGPPNAGDVGTCRGNTARFREHVHHLWKCPRCLSIHNIDPADYADLYRDYPLNKRRLDAFARGTFGNLLRRLKKAGLSKRASILDYGCGNGLFVQWLRAKGYTDTQGYDPYVAPYVDRPKGRFDYVIANDVIEHVDDPRETIKDCARLVVPGGCLYIGTADSEPVDMSNLEPHIMRLHQPFHRVIITQDTLLKMASETGFEVVRSYRRSYMDTLIPFSNYRFLDEYSKALGHNMDAALKPSATFVLMNQPRLWFFAFFGYFLPVAAEPAVVLRRPG